MTEAKENINVFVIPEISQTRVTELLLSILTHKATGCDEISIKLLMIAAPASNLTFTYKITKLLSKYADISI